jgi:hypothetical protein
MRDDCHRRFVHHSLVVAVSEEEVLDSLKHWRMSFVADTACIPSTSRVKSYDEMQTKSLWFVEQCFCHFDA